METIMPVEITWLGHSCFRLRDRAATVVTDPYGKDLGLNLVRVRADIVTVSHDADDHNYVKGEYRPVVQISTDGFAAYPESVDLDFGPFVKHGVLIKQYRNARLQYDPSEIVGTERRPLRGDPDPWSICTSHVERQNCTVRQFCKRFTRLTLGFSKSLDHLAAAVGLYMGERCIRGVLGWVVA